MTDTNYCCVCGAPIKRRRRANGALESITQYSARKTCGYGSRCYSVHKSRLASGRPQRPRGSGFEAVKPLPVVDTPPVVHAWLYSRPVIEL